MRANTSSEPRSTSWSCRREHQGEYEFTTSPLLIGQTESKKWGFLRNPLDSLRNKT